MTFETAVGDKSAGKLDDGRIALSFGAVEQGERVEVAAHGRNFAGFFVVSGVPHFVIPVADVAAVPLMAWSPALRAHERFGRPGANVDFVSRRPDGRLAMRTYERGVEGETLACGSGAIASALWAVGEGASAPVTIRTAGGDDLVVDFRAEGEGRVATLTGPAVVVFRGEWPRG